MFFQVLLWTTSLLMLTVLLVPGAPAPGASGDDPAPPLGRVAVRDGSFIDTATGERFEPRGLHYIRLLPDGRHYVLDPGRYDAERIEAMLMDLKAHGYNVVRIFVGHIGVAGDRGLASEFIATLCDFLKRAQRHGVRVILVPDFVPPSPAYDRMKGRVTDVGQMQLLYLDPGHVAAKQAYLNDLVGAIKVHDPDLLSTVFAYELENEACYFVTEPPFAGGTGSFEYDGRVYDLSSGQEAQALLDAAVADWADAMVEAIHEVDPEALVSCSVFSYEAVGRSGPGRHNVDSTEDARAPVRPLVLAKSKLSYLDIHLYAPSEDGLANDLASMEWPAVLEACRRTGKPILMGEFGALRREFADAAAAAEGMNRHIARAEAEGFGGWVYWTYDCDEQPELFNAMSEGGVILGSLTETHTRKQP